jgi:hypothetical protein
MMRAEADVMTRLALIAALITLIASPSMAQVRARGQRIDKRQVERIIKRLENNTDAFKKAVDRQLDRSVLDGTSREDRINDRVNDLENATDRLRSRFDRSDEWMETRGDVEGVLREARLINGLFGRVRGYSPVRSSWAHVRGDINALASAYRLPGLR